MNRQPNRRLQIATLAAVVMAALVTAPAHGAKPTRTVSGPSEHWFIPAGFGCSFAVLVQPAADESSKITQFDDAHTRITHRGNTTFTNWDSGASVVHGARFQRTVTHDQAANTLVATVRGRVSINLWPGDYGPYGVVSEPGLLVAITGSVQSTFDFNIGSYTAFSFKGQLTDVCALLA